MISQDVVHMYVEWWCIPWCFKKGVVIGKGRNIE